MERLTTKAEFGNPHDPYTIATVTSDDTVVGHLPRTISTLCHIFLRRSGNIIVQIIGRRKHSKDLLQGGLDVPCSLTFVGESKELSKIEKLSSTIPAMTSLAQPPQKRARIDFEENESCAFDEGEAVWLKFDGIFLTERQKGFNTK